MHLPVKKMNQKGFTLIEILVTMAVSSLVIMAVVMSMYQISWGIIRTNDRIVALNDINSAVPWLKRDIQMAQTTNLTLEGHVPTDPLSLHWLDLTFFATDNVTVHDSVYSLSGTELVRTRYYDSTPGPPMVIGRNITSIGFTLDNNIITVSITATGPPGGMGHTETFVFSVLMRSAGVQ